MAVRQKRKWTPSGIWRPKFLAAFAVCMNWTYAAEAAGCDIKTAKRAYDKGGVFHEEVDAARQACIDSIEFEFITRARDPKHKGDRLLMEFLRIHKPEVYDRPRQHALTGPNGGPIQHDISANLLAKLADMADRYAGTDADDEPDTGAPDEAPGEGA